MTQAAVTKLPASKAKAHFDLDALQKEAAAEPFVFQLGGESFTMQGPDDADWQTQARLDANSLESLADFLREVLGGDKEFARFSKHKLPAWKFWKLVEACRLHYGVSLPE